MAATPPLNDDFERRAFWQASMPALPDRSGRAVPASTDVVVIGGGYAGITAARELARRGLGVTLLEAHTLGWGASTRNGGIVHAGYKWSARELIKRYGQETGKALYQETLDSYELVKTLIADEAIDCDFREVGHLELAYAPAHAPELDHARESLASVGVSSTVVPRERIREEIGSDAYFGALVVEGSSALLHPGRYFAGLAAAADQAGADLHEAVRARSIRREDSAFVVRTRRGDIRARDVFVATNGYTDGVVPSLRRRIIPIGSYIIASEPLPEALAHELSPKGRAFFDTKNFLYYWHVTSDRLRGPRVVHADHDRPDGRDPLARAPRGPSAAGGLSDRVRLGRQRRLHVRPDAARRTDEGRRDLCDGLLRDWGGADDEPRDEGGGVAGGR
jgi:glycine/D-amino acid oxidase-like deaminating enzyme